MTDSKDTPATAAELVARILDATERYEVALCDRSIAEAFVRFTPAELVREVLSPALRTAGDRWYRGQITVVQEHLLSGAVRRQLFYALDHHNRSARGPTLAFTTLSGELHEMGTLMCAMVAASRGFHCIHLGPDLPAEEIARFCVEVPVAAVALSVITHPAVIDATGQLGVLRQRLPPTVELWIGGMASEDMRSQHLPENTFLLKDLDQLMNRLPIIAAAAGFQLP